MKRIIYLLFLAATVFQFGCASMINGTSQNISVSATERDAKLYMNGEYIATGNGIATLKKKEDYILTAKKDGCTDTSVPVSKSFDPTTLLGILIDFGIISMLVIDGAVTGAWNKFDRTNYTLEMRCGNN